jgi:energy-coupling factor transport system permease protein
VSAVLGANRLFYRRLSSPIHAARAGVGAAWALGLMAAALILDNPLLLAALLIAVIVAAVAAGVGAQLAGALRRCLYVVLPIVAINVLVSRNGLTVFARLGDLGPFGQGDLTVEAAVYGAVISLKVTLLILVTTLAGLVVDPDELLRGLRALSFRSALTASLATRMIPLLAADSQRLAEAQRTRPDGAPAGARARIALLTAVVGGSLDRAMDVAATLELRGFAASGRRARRVAVPWSRHDFAFGCSAVLVPALALYGRLGGSAAFHAYPIIHGAFTGSTFALCAALVAIALLPFLDRRGIEA